MTSTRILEILFKEGASLEDLDWLIDPNLSTIIYSLRKKHLTLGDLIAIIKANQLPEELDFEHLEEKVDNHLEMI